MSKQRNPSLSASPARRARGGRGFRRRPVGLGAITATLLLGSALALAVPATQATAQSEARQKIWLWADNEPGNGHSTRQLMLIPSICLRGTARTRAAGTRPSTSGPTRLIGPAPTSQSRNIQAHPRRRLLTTSPRWIWRTNSSAAPPPQAQGLKFPSLTIPAERVPRGSWPNWTQCRVHTRSAQVTVRRTTPHACSRARTGAISPPSRGHAGTTTRTQCLRNACLIGRLPYPILPNPIPSLSISLSMRAHPVSTSGSQTTTAPTSQ